MTKSEYETTPASDLPRAKDLSHLLSHEAQSRNCSALKSAFKYFKMPDMTFLGGGLPMADLFPFESISAEFADPSREGTKSFTVHKHAKDNDHEFKDVELARSLQYGYTEGQPELVQFLKEHTEMIHKPKYADWGLVSSIGNTESWDATLRTFATRGDSILVEEFSFSSALEAANAQGVNTIPVPMDHEGLQPDALAKILDDWVGPKPKFLYTICTGQNPTGSCLSEARRREVYKLAQKHDFLIVEDEPYYFLQMEQYTKDKQARQGNAIKDHGEFLDALVPSFLSLDTEGRVLRLDSFSKVLAPGLRLGWIVGSEQLLERYVRIHEVSVQAVAGPAQTLANGLLQRWGQAGYLDWLIGLRAEYTHKRDVAIDAIEDFFPKEVVTYVAPVAGMFFTFDVDATKHPKFKELGEDPIAIETRLYETAIKNGVLLIPGSWFKAEGQSNPPQAHLPQNPAHKSKFFFRGTYAAVPLDKLRGGLEKFGKAIREEFGL